MNYLEKIERAYEFVNERIPQKPQIGIILGTGLGTLADYIDNQVVINYSDIPEFPVSTIEGHAGRLIYGELEGKSVLAMQGRFHYYEGYSMQEITLPIRVMKKLGINMLLLSNACGGLNESFSAGDIMIITDHINMMGDNPLIGANLSEFGQRFPDMSQVYDPEFIELCSNVGSKLGLKLHKGVYTAISGPNYSSKAELKMLIAIGSDTVGMSTIPEAVAARHSGMKILGLSCITDMALPDSLVPLSHEEVVRVAELAKPRFVSLVREFIREVRLSESL